MKLPIYRLGIAALYIFCGICLCNFLWFIQQQQYHRIDAWMNLMLGVFFLIVGLSADTEN